MYYAFQFFYAVFAAHGALCFGGWAVKRWKAWNERQMEARIAIHQLQMEARAVQARREAEKAAIDRIIHESQSA